MLEAGLYQPSKATTNPVVTIPTTWRTTHAVRHRVTRCTARGMYAAIPDMTKRYRHDSGFDEQRTQVLADNTAQSILNNLTRLRSGQPDTSRWIWELVQNARDAARDSQGQLTVSVRQSADSVVFEHDGGSFDSKEVIHLIYHGSTKVESDDTIGQYGSGFLTTHLLSSKIEVSGHLKDGRGFCFLLERSLTSVDDMTIAMQKAFEDFKTSLRPASGDAVTRFKYPMSPDAEKTVAAGIAQLRHCAPYVLAFNKDFCRIRVSTPEGQTDYTATSRDSVSSCDRVTQVTVAEKANDKEVERCYFLAERADVMVAVPIASTRAVPLGPVPRIFVGFPLVGTEDFSFPAVINSRLFKATPERDGVFLKDLDLPNPDLIHIACELLVDLLKCVLSQDIRDAHILSTIPTLREREWFDKEWLTRCLLDLISRIRNTRLLRTCTGKIIPSVDAAVPFTDNGDVTELWQLFQQVIDYRERLVCQEEAAGWAKALRSWLRFHKSDLDEVYDGRALIRCIAEKSGVTEDSPGTVEQLRKALGDGSENTVTWLSRCHDFLKSVGLGEYSEQHCIVPSQEGILCRLDKLYRDTGIDNDLKKIARILSWDLELRDQGMKSLDEKPGKGDRGTEDVLTRLIARVMSKANDQVFQEASASLFSYLVAQQEWHKLKNFVVYSQGDSAETIELGGSDPPLAPLGAWEPTARTFSDLFPKRRILAERFYTVVPDASAWSVLDREGLVLSELLIHCNRKTNTLRHDEPRDEDRDHESEDEMSVTKIAYMQTSDIGIMNRVRKSPRLAYMLWRFLAEYVVSEKNCVLEQSARCECGTRHRYVVASWLEPVRNNRWIPKGKDSTGKADERNIAKLLRGNGASADGIWDALRDSGSGTHRLLKALGIAPNDVMKEWYPGESRRLEECIGKILALAGGAAERLEEAVEVLEEQAARRKTIRRNQRLGQYVENEVQNCLEAEGFEVQSRHEGADLEIILGDSGRFDLVREGRMWLVEIKATRADVVRMSRAQAREAVDRGNEYLLCVVPTGKEDTPTSETVRGSMRFVEDIGLRLTELVQGANKLDQERGKLISDEKQGVRLEVERGVERFRISETVWAAGFSIDELLGKLLNG